MRSLQCFLHLVALMNKEVVPDTCLMNANHGKYMPENSWTLPIPLQKRTCVTCFFLCLPGFEQKHFVCQMRVHSQNCLEGAPLEPPGVSLFPSHSTIQQGAVRSDGTPSEAQLGIDMKSSQDITVNPTITIVNSVVFSALVWSSTTEKLSLSRRSPRGGRGWECWKV